MECQPNFAHASGGKLLENRVECLELHARFGDKVLATRVRRSFAGRESIATISYIQTRACTAVVEQAVKRYPEGLGVRQIDDRL